MSCFYETLWTVLSPHCGIPSSSHVTVFNYMYVPILKMQNLGGIFHGFCTPKILATSPSPAHLKALDLPLAWNHIKEALTWISEGKHCGGRLSEMWGREEKKEGRVKLQRLVLPCGLSHEAIAIRPHFFVGN